MENSEISSLIDAFTGYREMLVPIQQDLHEFLETYSAIKGDVDKLGNNFSGEVKTKLTEIYKILESQASKSEELAKKVDQFLTSTNKYTDEVDHLISLFESISGRIQSVNELEARAEEQINKLDTLFEEKSRNYNLKELEKSMETYNANLSQVSEFINKEVAENLVENSKSIQMVRDRSEEFSKQLLEEKRSIESLAESYNSSTGLLKKLVEKEDVNEQYIFDILDRWAESRKVKTKK